MKSSETRLMDLLAGWADFVSSEEESNASYAEPEINQKIYYLYQEVANRHHMTSDERIAYFIEKIAAILKRGE